MKTTEFSYTQRLSRKIWWKNLLDVQRPYRDHIQSLGLGTVLEIGCGVGRNLINLGCSKDNIGIDHNENSVNITRSLGLTAYTPNEFKKINPHGSLIFDTILVSHVFEHLTPKEAKSLLLEYLPYLKTNGKVVIVTPQKVGFSSDPTHITMMDPVLVGSILISTGLEINTQYSFPFSYWVGNFFKYNENISIGIKIN
jgi:2-polyprenyl-3-methyl-5-hydroxy-6-metoxy-1,4-benzoquinol methylase